MKCSNCGSELKQGASFCTNCGQKLEETSAQTQGKFCTKCGAKNLAEAKFCDVCGNAFNENQTTSNKFTMPRSNVNNKNILMMALAGVVVLALILAFVFGLRSCSGSKLTANKAEKIVQNFFDELLDLNLDKAMTYVSEKGQSFGSLSYITDLDIVRDIYDKFGKDVLKIKVDADSETLTQTNENEASITMEVEMKINSKIFKKDSEGIMRFSFLKEDGKWKIDDVETIKDFDFYN